ncbi:hypothetical protein OG883_45005 [Streptomyces sp. NBC_01142]|uniref:hypothetical protein n=1 Tax=Streptomyces sp. NBC_01142 TaxID=2975865 RepID=UPI0022572AD1|nr:hypothetical protein [Streptomyces sp. NBC_01142]MCX4826800.1 hypothetical protein [Streptomyces sp. NBC_01142]
MELADGPSGPAQFTPSLRVERFDEVVQYDNAMTAKPPQRTYEKVWQGQCGPDFAVEDGEDSYRVRPVRLRVRWFQDGDATPRWNSIEVTGHEVLPDKSLRRHPVREIWTRYHAELGQVPDWFLQFVSANLPAPRTAAEG